MSGSVTGTVPLKSARPYDIILWGATGFTGELVAERLFNEYPSLRWALAGRDLKKLEAVRAKLNNPEKVQLVSASLTDPSSISSFVSSTRVVLSTVGPFTLHGEAIVRACAQHGTDYCDITGETNFSLSMINKYQDDATRTGAAIVSFCGYDSIPSDLGAFFVAQQLQKQGTEAVEVKAFFEGEGRPSGGTINTMLTLMASPSEMKTVRHPRALNPEGETKVKLPQERDQMWLKYDTDLKRWTVPFVMALTNTRVARRSIGLYRSTAAATATATATATAAATGSRTRTASPAGYGPAMTYNESMPVPNVFAGVGILIGLGIFVMLAAFSWGRAFLRLFVPAPGQGPDAVTRAKSKFKTTLIGKGADGSQVTAIVRGGDPGYTETSRMLVECGVLFATQRDSLPLVGAAPARGTAGSRGGFLTPATAFGDVLLQRLNSKGITFTNTTGNTNTNTNTHK